jgi:AcrR family transcriptional regulator
MTPVTPPARRRNSAETRRRILAAATKAFAERGYTRAGIREIAAAAGVSIALILRYFGSKAGLFEAALTDSINLDLVRHAPQDSKGGAALDGLLAHDVDSTAMALLSAGDAEVRDIIVKVARERVFPVMAELIGGPNAEEKALNIIILACGHTYSTRIAPVGPGDNPETREWMRRTIQQIVSRSPGEP